jgi:hypothetical protein
MGVRRGPDIGAPAPGKKGKGRWLGEIEHEAAGGG